MSLVILASTQYQDSSEGSVVAQDAGHYTCNFSEPLELFPGQTVEFVSFLFKRALKGQEDYPALVVSIPELQCRMFNSSRQNVQSGIAFIPTTVGFPVASDVPIPYDRAQLTIPTPLRVNVPSRMLVNQLTCRVSLLGGQSAGRRGGITDAAAQSAPSTTPSNDPFLTESIVVLRLSAPPDQLAA